MARAAGPPKPPTAMATRRTTNCSAPPWTRAPTRSIPPTVAAPATGPGRPTCRQARPAADPSGACRGRGSRPARPARHRATRAPRTARGPGRKIRPCSRRAAAHGRGPDGAAGRPGPGQRSPPTAGGQPRPPDGGGAHNVERAAGPTQRLPDASARPEDRGVPQLRGRLRPDGGRTGRRPRPRQPRRPGRPGPGQGEWGREPHAGGQPGPAYGPADAPYGQAAQAQARSTVGRRRAGQARVRQRGPWAPVPGRRNGRPDPRLRTARAAVAGRDPAAAGPTAGPMPPGRDQYAASGQFGSGQPWAGHHGPQQPGQGPAAGPTPPPGPRQAWYGPGHPGAAANGFGADRLRSLRTDQARARRDGGREPPRQERAWSGTTWPVRFATTWSARPEPVRPAPVQRRPVRAGPVCAEPAVARRIRPRPQEHRGLAGGRPSLGPGGMGGGSAPGRRPVRPGPVRPRPVRPGPEEHGLLAGRARARLGHRPGLAGRPGTADPGRLQHRVLAGGSGADRTGLGG